MQSTKPDWKSEDKNLTKKYPRSITQSAEDETDFEGDIGSFFVYFEEAGDQLQVSRRPRLDGQRKRAVG